MVPSSGLKPEDRDRIASKLDEVARKIQQRAASDAMTALEPVRVELTQAAKDYTLERPTSILPTARPVCTWRRWWPAATPTEPRTRPARRRPCFPGANPPRATGFRPERSSY